MANRYFRGQGTVKIGPRTAQGGAGTLRPIGNCPILTVETSKEYAEHFESETGDRRMDLRILTSLKVNISFTIENFVKENLQLAFQGTLGTGGSGDEVIEAFNADPTEYYLKFEGMNTLEGKSPVTVDFFKVDLDSAASLELISDDLVGLEMSGSVLYDPLNEAKGGYFTITQKALPTP